MKPLTYYHHTFVGFALLRFSIFRDTAEASR